MVRLPLDRLPDETWRTLRRLAYHCASYCNHLLTLQYAAARGLVSAPEAPTAYQQGADTLAGAVRDALGREVIGLWRRHGRAMLRGEQTLGRFSVDRALVVRDRGVRLLREPDGRLVVQLRLVPKAAGAATRLPVWAPALRKDPWLQALTARLWAGEWPVLKATVRFRRPGRAVDLLLTYARPLEPAAARETTATLTWTPGVEEASRPGELWLRANGRALSLHDWVHRLAHMKAHYAAIHARLRRDLGKRGRRRTHRRALLAAGSFEAWAVGPLHQLSRQIVRWCQQQGAGRLVCHLPADGGLPWHRLVEQVRYKAEEVGLLVEMAASSQEGVAATPEGPLRTDGG